MEYIFTAVIWFALGALAMYVYTKNKTSIDPTSLRDEFAAVKAYIDLKFEEAKVKAEATVDKVRTRK